MSNFDGVARTWDENPIHMERSLVVAEKMEEKIPFNKSMEVLEYGAGTGILSFLLSNKVGHITMMDNSPEMVRVMKEKVLSRKADNLTPVCFNLETDASSAKYHLIFNQMVLHHIQDISSIFEKFYKMLLPGGFLTIADLYPEDGSFHGEGFVGHLGFDPEQLKQQLLATGFKNADFKECYTVKRQTEGKKPELFPIFLLTASK